MKRRDALKLLALWLPATRLLFAQPPRPADKTLITLFLRGGVDGLAMVQPTGDAALRTLRSTLLHEGPSLDGFFSLHPSLRALLPRFEQKQLAVVHAVGQASPSRSHFEAQDALESGLAGSKRRDGYLNRALEDVPTGAAFRAVALQNTLPRALAGDAPALAFPSLAQFRVGGRGGTFESLYADAVDQALRTSGHDAFESLAEVKQRQLADEPPRNGARYPTGPLGKRLADLARLIHAGVGLRVGVTEATGFDTHLAQGGATGQLANRLQDLGDALAAFAQDLGRRLDDVTLVTVTEFGRTARENGTRGTDHGTASAALVLGGGVHGGRVVTRWPGLSPSQLFEGRDLAATTDVRAVLAECLTATGLEAPLTRVFPDFKPRRVGLFG